MFSRRVPVYGEAALRCRSHPTANSANTVRGRHATCLVSFRNAWGNRNVCCFANMMSQNIKIQGHMGSLNKYRSNVHSQNGEDGVVAELCARLNIRSGAFVEVGAWDGKYLSNTYRLLEEGWSGVYIEGDKQRFDELNANMMPFQDRVTTVNAFVSTAGENRLDCLLSNTPLSRDFELLSIDIDSYDWQIWESLCEYRPKIVIIEVNSHIPVGIYQVHNGETAIGSSFSSTVQLGRNKGYTPVCHTGNLILVRDDLVDALGLPEAERRHPELLFDYNWMRLCYANPFPENFPKIFWKKCLKKLVKLTKRMKRPSPPG